MKVKVIKEFIDVHSKKIHKVDEEFECTDERFAEIMKVDKKLVKKIAEPTATKKKSEEKE